MPRTLRTLAALSLAALAVPGLASCTADASAAPEPTSPVSAAVTVDNCGTEVTVDGPPQRIVTVKSSTLELALALGAGDRIVGTAYSDGPLPADLASAGADIPVLADKVPSQEAVLALNPDFVFAGWESNFSADGVGERDALQQLGVTTYVAPAACQEKEYQPDPLTFDAVFDSFLQAGDLLGEKAAAQKLVAAQKAQLAKLTPDDRGLTAVWYSSGSDQPFVGAGIGAPQLLMHSAGLTNAFADVKESWFSTSWEKVADLDPDVIVLVDSTWNTAQHKIDVLKANPVTSTLKAVRDDAFLTVDFPATESGVRNVDAVSSLIDQLAER
ncbi:MULTISPECIES: putative F420-0 ABC transporter substrate-binding protein [unclassified Microbacterium]|uniref:putative F420-0 ABC transporter substrate-binding protein n=1 Tax=unclassified Microbacterium TaxID=2609290 RepID=UPI0012FA8BBB|nr:putative F420-0 ABC transporter substrate-binding protein [Microbacterium sp. MAH-37]MVQ43995.1 putative F420-0 ABC transporter substrate-binding protein [Microbacterium sp. MAH-37]